jgi:hypothetical protein
MVSTKEAASVTVRVPKATKEKLIRLAQKEQRSLSNLVVLILNSGIQERSAKRETA